MCRPAGVILAPLLAQAPAAPCRHPRRPSALTPTHRWTWSRSLEHQCHQRPRKIHLTPRGHRQDIRHFTQNRSQKSEPSPQESTTVECQSSCIVEDLHCRRGQLWSSEIPTALQGLHLGNISLEHPVPGLFESLRSYSQGEMPLREPPHPGDFMRLSSPPKYCIQ